MSIKERIINKRKELGLNQKELAKRAGLQPPTISQYESGLRNPSYEALVKLSNALNISIDYLVSGVQEEETISLDTKTEVLLKIFQNLNSKNKERLLEYAFISAGYDNQLNFFSTDPKKYAKYIFENILKKEFPVDVYDLSNKLNVKIIFGDLNGEAEAILQKRNSTIILDQNLIDEKARTKFAIAYLLGHYLIPWHTQSSYNLRQSGRSTLLTDVSDVMEASSFAFTLITPPLILEQDLSKLSSDKVSLIDLKELADKKYKVSLSSLCNRLVEYDKNRFAKVTSNNFKIDRVFSGNMLVKEKGSLIDENSKTYELFSTVSNKDEIKEGIVRANSWINEVEEHETLFESSIYNPTYNSVLTLLTRIKK